MENFKHYGVEVVAQSIDIEFNDGFESTLKKNGVEYHYLPLVEDRVIKYSKDGETRYAFLYYPRIPDEMLEYSFITKEVPDDMNWKNLYEDYKKQSRGEEPMKLPTRAKVLCQKAEERLSGNKEFAFENFYRETSESEFNMSLIHLESSLEEIRGMDHHDVDLSFLK